MNDTQQPRYQFTACGLEAMKIQLVPHRGTRSSLGTLVQAVHDASNVAFAAPGIDPVAYPSGDALYLHLPCKTTQWWNEEVQGPINEQGCDGCEATPDGQWRPLYVGGAA